MRREIYKDLPLIPPQPLLSIEPLFRLLREEQIEDTEHIVKHLAFMLGVERKSIHRWMQKGMGLPQVESIASKLGLHPSYVWGPEYHIVSYMDEMRRIMIENHRSKKASIRRSIRALEKRKNKNESKVG
jgi:hypothetical protein